MPSGTSGRVNSGSKGFNFGSDDILCSYEDYGNHDSSHGSHGDPVVATNNNKDFHKSRISRTSVFPPAAYNQPEDSLGQEVFSTVERSMKKQTDNIMRFLEGLSSRLSQLELYCYNLDKSIGEIRSDLNRDHEVHKSVQIIRDKQELAETQKELAQLQHVQKDSSSSHHSQSNEERASPPASELKRPDTAPKQQLALCLPHQVSPQQPSASTSLATVQNVAQVNQQQPYYMTPTPTPSPPPVTQLPQNQYMPSDSHYRTAQVQDLARVGSQPLPSQVTQTLSVQQFHHYQQQQPWLQQLPQQMQPLQQSSMQQTMRPTSPMVYPTYPLPQQTNTPPLETTLSSMPMQMSYSGIPPPESSRADTVPYGYPGTGKPVTLQSPQPIKASFPTPPGDMYGNVGTHAAVSPGSASMIYESDGGRTQHPPQPSHFAQRGNPPQGGFIQNPQANHNPPARNTSQSQFYQVHPYSELIEKLGSMGFRGDHVAIVIQRMEENGQPIDFNSVLDRLNVHPSVGPQRPWSG